MWIVPKNHKLFSQFAQDMVDSKEDLVSLDCVTMSSLAWRSKVTPWRIWLQKWNRVKWIAPLFGRMLKPFQQKAFEEKYTELLPAIHASRFQLQEKDGELKTPDTFTHTLSEQLELFSRTGVSSRTYQGISQKVLGKSSKDWKEWITELKREYSQREKLALRTKENGYSYLPTITVCGNHNRKGASKNSGDGLSTAVKRMLPTLNAQDFQGLCPEGWHKSKGKCLRDVIGGALNPNWCEWFMGLPIGWTVLGSWETESSHSKQQKPLPN